ncbi:MAG: hypothetical protein JXA99_03800 [Candidatus Lokiarchaeota archaeon]|nr:hypothetical protein [Candidatus Lokiarchaeota archaeon]
MLAELLGIHIGDGYLGYRKERKSYLVQCMGNPRLDKQHYDLFMLSAWKKLFNIDLKLRNFQNGCYGFMVHSKAIGSFFHNSLEMPIGKKCKTINIPDIIKRTYKKRISQEIISCIRGIIDTDFFLTIDRGHPELGAFFMSRNLVLDLNKYLKLIGMNPTISLDKEYFDTSCGKNLIRHRIRIRKKKDVKKWIYSIGTHNPKFYKKINILRL